MGRNLSMMRWWIIMLVGAIALTSCSRSRSTQLQANYGFGYCDGTLGSFDVYVIQSDAQPDLYELRIVPYQLTAPGDIVAVTVANQSLAYKEIVPQVVLFTDQEIFAGYLTETELLTYDILAITPYQPGVTFLEASPESDAICTLPLPGDGTATTQQ